MQAYTLPVRSYRRNTTASEPLEHSLSNDYDPTNARRSTTPIPFVRRRLNGPNRQGGPLPPTFRNASVPASSRATQENRPPPITPITNLPSYYSTYSLPMPTTTTLPRLPQQQQPLSIPCAVPAKRVKPAYQHRTFSFESPLASPELVVLPNHGGLEIAALSSKDGLAQATPAVNRTQIRSTSSSYPSEGACSPELTVSPPLTFGRRILSSLEAYGFSSAHLSILESEEEEDRLRRLTEDDKETKKSSQDDLEGLYPGEKRLSTSEADIAHAISSGRSPPSRLIGLTFEGGEDGGFALPDPESPLVPLLTDHILASDTNVVGEGGGGADENASTRCLPRVSTALSFPSFSDVHLHDPQQQEQEQEHVSFGTQLKSRISGHFRRVHIHPHHGRSTSRLAANVNRAHNHDAEFGEEQQGKTKVTTDVKKWLVKQFKAGKKGVRRVRKGLHVGHHEAGGGVSRKEKLLKEEMRDVDLKLEKERKRLQRKRRENGGDIWGREGNKERKKKKERGLRGRLWGLLV
ncbi:hypothetical protein QBC36DRAFT_193311 [Triangularia setosa]|uniref:Uncharacterized protein n=1 Tax=Triangularia setosa TaxID=2587417 RepID=A0AAN7A6D7_9PEZI|nr:hypothetical protein QBC36DRAFT_193311 [Podospora setosa]